MSVHPRFAAVALVALFATACTTDVTQESSPTSVRAVFDPDRSLIPTPNDLVLQAAPAQTDPVRRATFFAFIDAGGFPAAAAPNPVANPFSVINVPYELVVDGEGVGTTNVGILDPATVNTTTIAIVQVNTGGAPAVITPALVANLPGSLVLFPAGGFVAGARYAVGVRGGPNGVKTSNGAALSASNVVFLASQDIDLANPEARPANLTDEQAAALAQVRLLFAAPLDWGLVSVEAVCRAALGIPPLAPFPETRCWLPPQLPSAGIAPAFNAIDLVFPHAEAISIQTFEIAP
jgi:hypothetical protein